MERSVRICPTVEQLSKELSAEIRKIVRNTRENVEPGKFVTIGLSGGSMVEFVGNVFNVWQAEEHSDFDCSRIRFIMCDERKVPLENEDSNCGAYVRKMSKIGADVFVKINENLGVGECAKDYEQKLKTISTIDEDGMAKFDLLLLGMGPDGHTASLFPEHRLLQKSDVDWVAPIWDSPKPPPERVTLTVAAINNSRHVIFLVQGDSKSSPVKEVLENENSKLPSAYVRPKNAGKLFFFLDESAASKLTKTST